MSDRWFRRRDRGYISGESEMTIPPLPPAGDRGPLVDDALAKLEGDQALIRRNLIHEALGYQAEVTRQLLPVVVVAQDVRKYLNREPVILLPAHVAPGLPMDHIAGFRVIRTGVPTAMVGITPP